MTRDRASNQDNLPPEVIDLAGGSGRVLLELYTSPEFESTEDYSSQIPALQVLINLGYKYLLPQEIRQQRRGKLSNVLLEDILTEQLKQLNHITFKGQEYLFSEANIQEAIQRLKNIRYDGLVRTNEEAYDYLTLGTSLEQTIEGNSKSYSLRYIDWRNWQNNVFHVAAEFNVERTRSTETVRPDIVLFVNGIPFAVIECKAPKIEVQQAISQSIRNQRDDHIPKLFAYVQLLLATNKNEARYATTGTSTSFWALWREQYDKDEDIQTLVNTPLADVQKDGLFSGKFAMGRLHFDLLEASGRQLTAQDRALYSLCRPERLLDLAYQFTVFDGGDRKVARYQQFFAVKDILKRVKKRDAERVRKGGVIWHTQGSGKSLTMVMMAKALALDPDIPNPRVVIVTDRTDLDDQINKTFASCGMHPEQAESGRHLLKLIEDKTEIITTLIHKFTAAIKVRKFTDPDPNIFILVDESHRSQHGSFHPRMRMVFPNACYLGFTGTPLLKKQKNTFEIFGGIIDPPYTIRRAVEDHAVVPLLYEGRHSEQEVNQKGIDTWFERLCQGLNNQQKTDLKRKYSQASMLQRTEQTIYCQAFDISEHFRQNLQGTGFKAQLIAPRKATALKYKQFLDEIGHVASEVIISPPDSREGFDDMEEEPSDEVQKFWQQMMRRYGSEREYNKQIINSFKHRDTPEILIVVSKLITGFDAPRNMVLYLTTPLTGHTLLQAIARVNRLYTVERTVPEQDADSDRKVISNEKDFGYIIDYAGVLGELDKALTSYSALEGFDESDLEGAIKNMQEEVSKLPQHHANLLDLFNEIKNSRDQEEYEQFLADERRRDDFYEALALFSKTLAIALSSQNFLFETSDHQIELYKKDLKRFQNLKAAVKLRYQETVDYRDLEPKIQKLLDTHVSATEITRINDPLNIFDKLAVKDVLNSPKSSASKADTIASATKRTVTERMQEDPAFYEKFSKLIQDAIDQFRAKRISEAEYLRRATATWDAIVNRKADNQPKDLLKNSNALAFYGLLKPFIEKHLQSQPTIETLSAKTALAVCDIIESQIIRDWIMNEDVQNRMMNSIDDYLYDVVRDEHGIEFTPDEMDDIIQQSLQLARYRMAK